MPIHCIGLNHKTADLSLRERFAFLDEDVAAFLGSRSRPEINNRNHWEEITILSTCNRVEIYAATSNPGTSGLIKQLADFSNLNVEELESCLYQYVDEQAVSHLFRVAAGMDSMAVGEAQILGQVSKAHEFAVKQGTSGKILSRLFQAAIHAGKRVRSETAIGEGSVSISSLAAKKVSQKVRNLSSSKVVLLGAGEMAELAVEALRKRGVNNFHVLSRSIANARKLADRWQGSAGTLDTLPQTLHTADVLITSTSAPQIIVEPALIASEMENRGASHPLIIVDIAVPRNVSAKVGDLPYVYLYDIDTLNQSVIYSQKAREQEIPKAEKIILEELDAFIEYMAAERIVPVILKMRRKADQIRQIELEKALKRMSGLEPETQQQLAQLTKSIVNKILHSPTKRLREESSGTDIATYTRITQSLFGIEDAYE